MKVFLITVISFLTVIGVSADCEYGGDTYRLGENWKDKGDACIDCSCHSDGAVCVAASCLPPPCANKVKKEGTCCDYECKDIAVSGKIILPDNIQSPLPTGSCLVVYIQKAIQCVTCSNPLLDIAKMHNPTIINNEISYKLILPGDTQPGIFNVQATLNVGWCKSESEWIRDGDYKQKYSNEFTIVRNQGRKEVSSIKMEFYGKEPPKLFIKSVCEVDGKTYKDGDKFISKDCLRRCECKSGGQYFCVSLCPPVQVACKPGYKVGYHLVPVSGSECSCRKPKCEKSDEEQQVVIDGQVDLPTAASHPVKANSCLIVSIQAAKQCAATSCENKVIASTTKRLDLTGRKVFWYSLAFTKKEEQVISYYISALLNNGWCRDDNDDKNLRSGDYHTIKLHEFEVTGTEDRQYQFIALEEFKSSVDVKPGDVSGAVSGPLFSPRKIELVGYIILTEPLSQLQAGSCLNVAVRENAQCNGFECDVKSLAERQIKDPSIVDGKMRYGISIPEALPGLYHFGAVLNIGWCKSITGNGTDWILDGDYQNDYAVDVDVRESQPNVIRRDIKLVIFRSKTTECPGKLPIVACDRNPCEDASCYGFPAATCRANFCGGCNAEFYHGRTKVICQRDECPADVPIVGCVSNPCESTTCSKFADAKCYANFCGSCHAVFYVGYNKVDCGRNEDAGSVGQCTQERKEIASRNNGKILLGQYIPQCNANGGYSQMQCHENYCWCVQAKDGKKLTEKTLKTIDCSASCVKLCTREYKPVCCTNGKTYPNKCEFENAKCKDESLKIKNYFTCSDDIPGCVKPCTREYKPVCGTDGKTYSNKCEFENAKCKDGNLEIKNEFTCNNDVGTVKMESCVKPCTSLYSPVCGSNRQTFSNKCEFDNAKCKDNNLKIEYYFQCRPDILSCVKPCSRVYKPVCGNDGRTYSNECEFNNARCKITDLKISSYFTCRDDNPSKEAFPVNVVGYIKMNPRLDGQLRPGSCINVVVRESRQCSETDECDNEILATIQIKESRKLRIRNGKLRYGIKLPNGQPGRYDMEAVVNNGWCKEKRGNEYLRTGDYHNDISEVLVIREGNTRDMLRKDLQTQHFKATLSTECAKDVPIVGCALNPCDLATCSLYANAICQANFCGGCFAEFYVNGKKIKCDSSIEPTDPVYISGNIILPTDFTSTSLPSGSCVKMLLQENIPCEGPQCDNPVYATIQINDPLLEDNKIAYNMVMKERQEGSFIISATLNMGWCTSGGEWLRYGDFKNEFVNDFSLKKNQNDVKKDVKVGQYKVKTNETEKGSDSPVTLSGFVNVPSDVKYPLPLGSCLNMFIQEAIFCLYCENPILGRIRITDPTITDGKIPYKITMKNVKGKGQFLVQATLNVAWCGVGDEWIRYNDLHNEYIQEFELADGQTKAIRHVDIVRYQSKKPIARDDKDGVSVTGDVVLPYGSPIRLSKGSCLTMIVQENILCEDCDNPVLGTFQVNNPEIIDRRIPYKIILKKPKPGQYTVQAVLNIGWCKTDDEWIRIRDYQNDFAMEFGLNEGQLSAQMDIDVAEYKGSTKTLADKNSNDATVKGYITLPSTPSSKYPPGSCVRAFVQENIQCEYCVNPVLADIVIKDPKVENNKISYQMVLKNAEEDSYIISAFINIGWCGNEKETIRYGDYSNNIMYSFSLTSGETEVDQDVSVEKYIQPDAPTLRGPSDQGIECYDNGNKYVIGGKRIENGCKKCTCVVGEGRGEWSCNSDDCVKDGCIHNGKKYEEGESRYDECNTCSCGSAGNWACTIIACQTGVCYYEGTSYKNGQKVFDGCNNCICSVASSDEVGVFGCTQKFCANETGCTHGNNKYKTGDVRYEQCNSCLCGNAGGWSCTEIGCPKGYCYKEGKSYKDGQSFFDGCNNCQCSAPNKDSFGVLLCTLKYCPPKTACQTLRDSYGEIPPPGAHVPSCKANGVYEELQCHGSIGECWCVKSDTGREIANSRVRTRDGSQPPDCSRYCIKPCPRIYKPVCGTDGRTYSNLCSFQNAKCRLPKLQIKNYFVCQDDIKQAPPKECPRGIPISGCTFDPCAQVICDDEPAAVCKANYCGGCKADFYKDGKKITCSKTRCSEGCPFNYDPVCGSDGKTYPNRCSFEVEQCKDESKALYMTKEGSCDISSFDSDDLTISGKILLPANTPSDLPPDSCLNMKIQKNIACQGVKCENPVLSTLQLANPKIQQGDVPFISYTMQLKESTAPSYTVQTTLNVGWCKNDDEWIRNNDYTNDFSHTFSPPATGSKVNLDVELIKYVTKPQPLKKDPECAVACPAIYAPQCGSDGKTYPNKCALDATQKCGDSFVKWAHAGKCDECPRGIPISGCTFDPCAQVICDDEPAAVCKANYCGGCKADFYKDGKKITCSKTRCSEGCPFNYDPVCGSDGKTYPNRCSFEVEQCKDESKALYMGKEGSCDSDDLTISGKILLPANTPSDLPPDSCLNMRIQKNIACQGVKCENPVLSTLQLANPKIQQGDVPFISYTMQLKESTAPSYTVQTTLNVGWCKNDDEWIRNNDYTNDFSHTFSPPATGSKVNLDVELIKYVTKPQPLKKDSECVVACPAIYAPQCGSDGKTYSNKCALDAKQKCEDSSVQWVHAGKCDECPRGIPISGCTFDPCAQVICDDEPAAVCKANYCGGCKADFYKDGKKITCSKTRCSEGCPFNYDPVCGSDGKTYPNRCSFEVEQCKDESKALYMGKEGSCDSDDLSISGKILLPENTPSDLPPDSCLNMKIQKNIACQGIWCVNPVLSTIQLVDPKIQQGDVPFISYTIKLKESTAPSYTVQTTLNVGWCKNDDELIRNNDYTNDFSHTFSPPTTGSNVNLDIELIKYVTKPKPPKKDSECVVACPAIYAPQCGSDGKTYSNKCALDAKQKCGDSSVQWVHAGKCDECPRGIPISGCTFDPCAQVICDDEPTAVCKANYCGGCKAEFYKDGKKITCSKTRCSELCPYNYDPVCGSDGKTYPNRCSFEVEQCKDEIKALYMEKEGSCAKSNCQLRVDAENKRGDGRPLIGAYVPQCTTDGSYERRQCHGSTGYCWCVDEKAGTEIPGTKKGPGQGEVACASASLLVSGKVILPSNSPGVLPPDSCLNIKIREEILCEDCDVPVLAKLELIRPILESGDSFYIPFTMNLKNPTDTKYVLEATVNVGWCKSGDEWIRNGDFHNDVAYQFSPPQSISDGVHVDMFLSKYVTKPVQTSATAEDDEDECPRGTPIVSCSYKPCAQLSCVDNPKAVCKPNFCGGCNAEFFEGDKKITCAKTKCFQGCPYNYAPVCGSDGKTYPNRCSFEVAQCEDETKALQAAYDGPCKDSATNKCVKERDANSNPALGAFVPRCKKDGSFEQKQCSGSTGYCWCVDEETGEKLAGTEMRRGQHIDCSANTKTKCQSERDASNNRGGRPLVGGYVAQCKQDGSYEQKQCHGSTGYCWCVDEETGREVAGTKKGPGQGEVRCSGKSVEVKVHGDLIFPPTLPAVLPPNSCLNMRIIEERYCEGLDCETTSKASLQVKEPKITSESTISYDMILKDTRAPSYIIEATLNIGWCKEGDDWIKFGDFTTESSHTFSPPVNKNEVKVDLKLDEYVDTSARDKCLKGCTFIYEPVCASDGKTFSNKCLFEIAKCKNPSLTIIQEGQCNECPRGVPIVSCVSNPCDVSTCPAHPSAKCEANYCGGCNAVFTVDGKKVECIVEKKLVSTLNVETSKLSGAVASCDISCPDVYQPVCSSLRKTLSSDCHLKLEACTSGKAIFKMHDGACGQCQKYCTKELKPKCGTDGVTYSNQCLMNKKICETGGQVGFAYDGRCDAPNCPSACTREYSPQCGSDGVTYGNTCEMQSKSCETKGKVKFQYKGQCLKCSAFCSREYDPYCGTDGKTYGNRCMMNYGVCRSGGRVQMKYKGTCDKPSCPKECPRRRSLVCGSNDKTYGNLCSLQRVTCSSKGDVYMKHAGVCVSRCKRFDICPYNYNPICGTDGKTYSNNCVMRSAMCKSNGVIRRAYFGKCHSCPKGSKIVKCFANPCQTAYCAKYPRAKCQASYCNTCKAEFYLGGRRINNCGTECNLACTRESFPQCGNDGKTYGNPCTLNVARCESKGKIQLAYPGECKTTFYKK